jgi:hypothetical protein
MLILNRLNFDSAKIHLDQQNLREKNMRKIIDMQMKIGEKAIADIKFDLRSRDEIPKLLRGLQAIYCDRKMRERVFEVLAGIIPSHVDIQNGRKGMDLWKIFVLGALRLTCNWDYDKLHEIANNLTFNTFFAAADGISELGILD